MHKIWHDDAECVSSMPPIKKFHFKNRKWRTPDTLERPVVHHHEILQFLNLKMAAVRHLEISKLKFLRASHFGDTFCIVALNFVEIGQTVADISHFFRIFQVKCKYSLDDCAQMA